MTDEADDILFFSLAYLEMFGSSLKKGEYWTRCPDRLGDYNAPAYEFTHFGVPFDPKAWSQSEIWSGASLDAAAQRRFSRALDELESAGLIHRYAPSGRTKHIRFTADGLAAALEIVESDVTENRPQAREWIALALNSTTWGKFDPPPKLPGKAKGKKCKTVASK